MKPVAFLCGLLSLAVALPASAIASETECHENRFFSVSVKPYAEEPGARFTVRALTGGKVKKGCRFKPSAHDFVIGKPGDPLWFSALEGKMLVLTRSTGPQGDLVVYDLVKRKPVLDVPSDSHAIEKGSLSFWQRIGEATEKACPEFAEHQLNGFTSVIVQRKLLDLSSGKLTQTAEKRCEAVQ